MDIEQCISKPKQQSQNIKRNMTMAFYNGKEQLYLETDALDVSLGASLLQGKGELQFPRIKHLRMKFCGQHHL